MKSHLLLLAWLLTVANVFAQTEEKSAAVARLQKDVTYLASDELEGRLVGSKGEKVAYTYIIKEYKTLGLKPQGSKGYLQEFPYDAGKKTTGKNELIINGQTLTINTDYFPINISTNKKVKGSIVDVGFGMYAPQIKYDSYSNMKDLKGKIFLMECSTPEGDDPHSKYAPYADIKSRVDNAIAKGAVAVIFTNTNDKADDLKANLEMKSYEATVPVVFLKGESWKRVKREALNVADMTVNLKKVVVTGHNVVAFLDNQAATTVVIGGHFDHLGYDEFGGSLYRGDKAIHNGADDNASGTAGVLELARWLSTNDVKEKNNYLFINFSGEEEGLIGSKYWVEHATYDTAKINFMINLDMIGRYRADKGLEVGGMGTSPEGYKFIRSLSTDSLKLKFTEQGIGPSDHSSFYLANIPVLFIFTGTHEDYHKPSDDANLVNYEGEYAVLSFIKKILMQLDGEGTLTFSQTTQTDTGDVPQFKVRLGIIPDYSFEGPGLRIDGVTDGQPASKAGMQKGDIIMTMGDFNISDIMVYMKALASFQKGDTTKVKVKRGDQEVELNVTF
ncbi:MAG: M20/M25/M40 family metallo-hydrolase [Bacteroidetes bacterium]|nr:M20/M25/M40 family metallo-hydrolase [Bacteroidota bacterium]